MSPATPADTGRESEYVLLASGEDEAAPGKKTESRLAHYVYGTSTILLVIAIWYALAELDMIERRRNDGAACPRRRYEVSGTGSGAPLLVLPILRRQHLRQ